MRVTELPATVALRSFAAALALRDAFVALTGLPQAFTLKWPNDVLLNGQKVAGILLEASGDVLAIGIGVNLIAAPPPEAVEPGAVTPVSLLSETGLRITPEAFLDALAPAYAAREAPSAAAALPRCVPTGWPTPPALAQGSRPAPAAKRARHL